MTSERNAYGKGHEMGWSDALAYAVGTKADRRLIRRRIRKGAESYAAFWQGYADAFSDRAEQRAWAIRSGLVARTCNPHKLQKVLERATAVA